MIPIVRALANAVLRAAEHVEVARESTNGTDLLVAQSKLRLAGQAYARAKREAETTAAIGLTQRPVERAEVDASEQPERLEQL